MDDTDLDGISDYIEDGNHNGIIDGDWGSDGLINSDEPRSKGPDGKYGRAHIDDEDDGDYGDDNNDYDQSYRWDEGGGIEVNKGTTMMGQRMSGRIRLLITARRPPGSMKNIQMRMSGEYYFTHSVTQTYSFPSASCSHSMSLM